MIYHYTASDKDNKIIEGEYTAPTVDGVLQMLASKGMRPLNVVPLKSNDSPMHYVFGRIVLADKIFLTRYLALMLKVNTDLLAAINILITDFDKPAVKNFLLEVRENLTRGQPFYTTFEKYPRVFSSVFVNLVKAAESSGNLQKTFEDLTVSLQKEADLKRSIKSAFIYPIILMIVGLGIFLFLSLFALPKIAKVFQDSGINPPLFSKVVFAVGLFLGENVFVFLTLLVLTILGSIFVFGFTTWGRRLGNSVMSRMPVVNKVYRDIAIQRFAATYAALMKAGLPIIQVTKITADVVNSLDFKVSLNRIADTGLAAGLTIGEAFKRETVFPKVVTNLIAISEKAGHLDEVLETLADFYSAAVQASIRTLVAIVEPVLLLVMGLLVALIALAIIVPIYQLTTQF